MESHRRHALFIDGLLDELFYGGLRFKQLPRELLRFYLGPMVLHPFHVVSCSPIGERLIRCGDVAIIGGLEVGAATQVACTHENWFVEVPNKILQRLARGLRHRTYLKPGKHMVPGYCAEYPQIYEVLENAIVIEENKYPRTILKSHVAFGRVIAHNCLATVLWDGDRVMTWQLNDSAPVVSVYDRAPVAIVGGNIPAVVHVVYASGETELQRLFV